MASSFVEKLDAAKAEVDMELRDGFAHAVAQYPISDPEIVEALRTMFTLGGDIAAKRLKMIALRARMEEGIEEVKRSFSSPSDQTKTGLLIMFGFFMAGFVIRGFMPR
jgi:hypothetical protein